MKIKTSELQGAALDWAVAKCEEDAAYRLVIRPKGHAGLKPFMLDVSPSTAGGGWWPCFSTDWAQGGPIIERERFNVVYNEGDMCWEAYYDAGLNDQFERGNNPLIAAMRCYVASKLGEEVDIPEELIQERI